MSNNELRSVRRIKLVTAAFLCLCPVFVSIQGCTIHGYIPPADQGEGPDEDLRSFMYHSMNATLTIISFTIFHDEQTPINERCGRIAHESMKLQALAEKLLVMKPPLFRDRLKDYQDFVASLRQYANGMADAANEQDVDEVKFWFRHVKNVCGSCHRIYRFGEQTPIKSENRQTP